jgi:SAM-dependent methyltransferase
VSERDDIAAANRQHWERMAREGHGFTCPWLDLRPDVLRSYARGELDPVPDPLIYVYPAGLLAGVEGREVLCLASGGGQQSAVFGLLGARVTVLDLTEGQLAGDRRAAAHYGYEVTTIRGDMRDLSCLADEAFDLIYQAISMAFVPDAEQVYREVARTLRRGGLYRVGHCNPATHVVESDSWDGEGYRICVPYVPGRIEDEGVGTIEFRHTLGDIFNGLVAAGLSVREVHDAPFHRRHDTSAPPGSWMHMLTYVHQYFAIVAAKEPRSPSRATG